MQTYEYRVLPAPTRGEKLKGAKTTEERYAQTLAQMMNAQAREGWEFQRAETLPAEERAGLTRTRTVYLTLLVFRRAVEAGAAAEPPVPQLSVLAPAGPTPKLGPAI